MSSHRVGVLRAPASAWQTVLYHHAVDGICNFNVIVAGRVRGALDEEALLAAIQELSDRHEALRTTLHRHADDVEQHIWATMPVEVIARELSPDRRSVESVQEALATIADLPSTLEGGALFRAALLTLGDDDHAVALCMHHAITDAWSSGVAWSDLWALYTAIVTGSPAELVPLTAAFRDHVAQERARRGEESTRYWRQREERSLRRPRLPTTPPADHAPDSIDYATVAVSAPTLRRLTARAQALRISPPMAVVAALARSFEAFDAHHVKLAMIHANRFSAAFHPVVGFVAETAPLYVDVRGRRSLQEIALDVRREWLGMVTHRIPLWDLFDAVGHDSAVDEPFFDAEVNYLASLPPTAFAATAGALPLDIEPISVPWTVRRVRIGRKLLFAPISYEFLRTDDGGLRGRVMAVAGPIAGAVLEQLAAGFTSSLTSWSVEHDNA